MNHPVSDLPAVADLPESRPAVRAAPGLRTPAGRLVVQRGLFTGPSARVPEDLYCEVLAGTASRERERVTVGPGSQVSTNTYFGRVHATWWQRWTAVDEIRVELLAQGAGRVRLMASDTNKVWRIVAAADVDSPGSASPVSLTGPLDRFLDGGGMWIEVLTERGELTVSQVRWTVADTYTPRPTSVVVCTYNRVDECLDTLAAMIADPEPLACVDGIHVVDQGSDPLESRERFAEVRDGLGDRLRYLRQPNLGGAGGFTRGLFELTAGPAEEHRDALFMDDDVLLEPELLVRLTAFAACTLQPTIVGAQMLNLLHPAHLHISAEYADPERVKVGMPVPNAAKEVYLLGRDERRLPNVQDRRVDTEYNGWWSCLIPAEIVRTIGYPLPLFFQWDDIEFGYRARAHGFPSVSLPGAGVWHADFGWKDWDEWHRFFNLRNGLITAALRTPFDVRKPVKVLTELLGQYTVGMQYGLAVTLLEAVESFLEGPEILRDGSAAAAARIRRIRAEYPETKTVKIADLREDFRDLHVAPEPYEPKRVFLTWAKRVAYQVTGRAVYPTGMVPAGHAHWWFVSLYRKAVVTDMAETGVRVRQRDAAKARAIVTRGFRTLRRLYTEGPAVAARFRAAEPELTSRANWARLYGVDT